MKKTWRCFHCDEVFTSQAKARFHFGDSPCAETACSITEEQLRDLTAELSRYREEDTDLHREIAKLQCEHQQAVRRAEESGYAKGLHAQLEGQHSIETTLSALAEIGEQRQGIGQLEEIIVREANATYFASPDGGAKFRISELQARCIIAAYRKHTEPTL